MQIRTLKKNELSLLFHYSKEEQWENEELHTKALFQAHPQDFFIAFKDSQLFGFVLAVKYSKEFGFISNLLVVKSFRSQGFGKKLFKFACEHLNGCQIALDSVKGKEQFYEQFGFTSYFDVSNYVFVKGAVTLPKSTLSISSFEAELALEAKDTYTKAMILSNKKSYKAIKKTGSISSFGFSFEYRDGYKLHIESQDINETLTLFFALLESFENGINIYIQTSPLSPLQEAIAELLKMKSYDITLRMYNTILS